MLLDKNELDENELDKSEIRRKRTRRNVTEPFKVVICVFFYFDTRQLPTN